MDYQRQLLAELMNPLIPSAKKSFRDVDVCKNFLVGFCPHEMFLNTKVDMGKCGYTCHEEQLRKEYQESPERGRLGYEQKFYDLLHQLVLDIERSIARGRMRVETKGDEFYDLLHQLVLDIERSIARGRMRVEIKGDEKLSGVSQDEIHEKVIILEETVKQKLQQIRSAGESSNVRQALDLLQSYERSVSDLEHARQNDQTHPSYRSDKSMDVCDICGALLANDSSGQRIDAHLTGKQHNGFIKIRDALDEWKFGGQSGRSNLGNSGAGGGGGSGGNRDGPDRDRGGYRERERDRDRDRDRDRNRDRDRDRDRGYGNQGGRRR
eukprot:jgi/Hompol1/1974/HPOL_005034-RA